MKRYGMYFRLFVAFLLFIVMMQIISSMTSINLTQVTAAKTIEYEEKKYGEKIIIPKNEVKNIGINFDDGKKVEVVFELKVNEDMPIDIWFVNDDNYLLLSGGAQFLFYIDGSSQRTSYAKKIVTLTEQDEYKIVMTNYYSNQTVQLDIIYELRTYGVDTNKFYESSIFIYSLLITIAVLGILLILIFIKFRNHVQGHSDKTDKRNSYNKSEKNRSKSVKQKDTNKILSKKQKKDISSKNKVKDKTAINNKKSKPLKDLTTYCGYCGEPSNTPFCKKCGKKT